MAYIIVSLILAFGSGLCFGIVLGNSSKGEDPKDTLDLNDDGKVNTEDLSVVKQEVTKVAAVVKEELDLNNDGKVDEKDFKVAKQELKKVATQINKLKKVK
jgi:hypothetical protein